MHLPKPEDGGSFTPIPPGTHLGVCYRVIDLGTQMSNFQGETKTAHKIMISWEIPEERNEKGDPLVCSKFYTWSMHEKATLRHHLEAWRGKAFEDKDFGPGGFDIRNVIGKGCMLTISEEMRDGRLRSSVAGVGKVMKGLSVPEPHNPTAYLWIIPDYWDPEVFSGLSDKMRDMIRASPEYKSMMQNSTAATNGHGHDGMNDDIPF